MHSVDRIILHTCACRPAVSCFGCEGLGPVRGVYVTFVLLRLGVHLAAPRIALTVVLTSLEGGAHGVWVTSLEAGDLKAFVQWRSEERA